MFNTPISNTSLTPMLFNHIVEADSQLVMLFCKSRPNPKLILASVNPMIIKKSLDLEPEEYVLQVHFKILDNQRFR